MQKSYFLNCDFSKYKLLVAPMLYMVKPGAAKRIEKFVKKGGTLVTTYWSGIVNENDLCFLGGYPGPLRNVLGIWAEEIDALYDGETNDLVFQTDNELNLKGTFKSIELCDLIHAETARVLGVYEEDFYEGRSALTVNDFGKGKAYYIATRLDDDFNDAFYGKLIEEVNIKRVIDAELPLGVTVQQRTDGENNYTFIMNFNDTEQTVSLSNAEYEDLVSGELVNGEIKLKSFGVAVLKEKL